MIDPARFKVALRDPGSSVALSAASCVSGVKLTVLGCGRASPCLDALVLDRESTLLELCKFWTSSTVGLFRADASFVPEAGTSALLEEAMVGGFFRITVAAGGQSPTEPNAALRLADSRDPSSPEKSSSSSARSINRGLIRCLCICRSSVECCCEAILNATSPLKVRSRQQRRLI